jgi:hypothetical protein
MRTLIVSATRQNVSKTSKTRLVESLNSFPTGDFELAMTTRNHDGLPKLYNTYINEQINNEFDCLLFVHDDVYIDDLKCFKKIEEQFKNNIDVVGLAGATAAKVKVPALWHLMSEQKDWSGAVAHPHTDDTIHVTSFGPIPQRCLILDGLFLACKPNSLLKSNCQFDEQFSFHHYDLDFCLACNNAGLRMSTCNINVIHQSPGLLDPNSEMYKESEQKFADKYVKNRS